MSSRQETGRRRLSVAVIVRDEAAVLGETIESIRGVADDLFVLDTGSTDDTIRIAESAGARVATLPWTDDFAAARNCALEQIDADWILWLDAGESLTEESRASLRQFIDAEADPGRAYLLMVEVPAGDPSSSPEQAARIRLVPNLPELRFEGRVRETLEPALERLGLAVEVAPGRIERHRRENLPARKAAKARRDLKLVSRENERSADMPVRLLLAVGEAFSSLDEPEKARMAFLQATRLANRGSTAMLDAYYGLLTTYDGDPALKDQQLTTGLEALEIFPLDAQLLCAMGTYLQSQERLDLAERSFDTAVKYGRVDLETWHLAEIAEMAAVCLALTQQLSGKAEAARESLVEALERFPESRRVRRHLIELLIKMDRSDEAMRLAGPLASDTVLEGAWRNAILGACKGAAKDWLAALGYLQSAYVGGCRDPLCLRWLVVTLISSGQADAARPILIEWLRCEPASAEALAYRQRLEESEASAGSKAGPAILPPLDLPDTPHLAAGLEA